MPPHLVPPIFLSALPTTITCGNYIPSALPVAYWCLLFTPLRWNVFSCTSTVSPSLSPLKVPFLPFVPLSGTRAPICRFFLSTTTHVYNSNPPQLQSEAGLRKTLFKVSLCRMIVEAVSDSLFLWFRGSFFLSWSPATWNGHGCTSTERNETFSQSTLTVGSELRRVSGVK